MARKTLPPTTTLSTDGKAADLEADVVVAETRLRDAPPPNAKALTFSAAMAQFFGKRPDQTPTQFLAELRAAGDREGFIQGLEANGYQITNKPG